VLTHSSRPREPVPAMASSPARVVGDQAPVALPAGLPAHLTDSLVAELEDGDAAATSSLAAALAAVPDARRRRGRRHKLTGVLAIGACACLTFRVHQADLATAVDQPP
jgi:hypothetical protein